MIFNCFGILDNERSCNFLFRTILIFICKLIRWRYGAGIPIKEEIKPFVAPHGFYGIFISNGATIEDGCTIYQQVTIGANTLSDSKTYGVPRIGTNCVIGAGAKVIGNVSIGNDVRIGANAVVVNDIPDNCTVVLEKPRVIVHNKKDNVETF